MKKLSGILIVSGLALVFVGANTIWLINLIGWIFVLIGGVLIEAIIETKKGVKNEGSTST